MGSKQGPHSVIKKSIMNKKTRRNAAIGAAAAMFAASAAAAYFLYGKRGASNRKKIKVWAVKAKGEVLQNIAEMRKVSQAAYNEAVDTVLRRYARVKTVGPKEAQTLARELKGHWRNIQQELKAVSPRRPKRSQKRK